MPNTDVTDAMIEAGWAKIMLVPGYPRETKRSLAEAYLAMQAARPLVQTDGLVNLMGRVKTMAADPGCDITPSVRAVLNELALTIEALQRSNAEKDEALRQIRDEAHYANAYLGEDTDVEAVFGTIECLASKALSHSSETSNAD